MIQVLIDAGMFLPRRRLLGRGADGAVGGVLGARRQGAGCTKKNNGQNGDTAADHTSEYAASDPIKAADAG